MRQPAPTENNLPDLREPAAVASWAAQASPEALVEAEDVTGRAHEQLHAWRTYRLEQGLAGFLGDEDDVRYAELQAYVVAKLADGTLKHDDPAYLTYCAANRRRAGGATDGNA